MSDAVRGWMFSAFVNAGTIALPKLFKAAVVLVVDVLVARHLGAEKFGLFSLVFAIFLILGILSRFGLESLLVRERVNGRVDRDRICDVLAVRLIGGTIAVALFVAFVFWDRTLSPHVSMLLLLSLGFWAVALSIFEPMMQAEERFVSLAVSQILVVAVGGLVKIVLIVMEADVGAFWLAILAEAIIGAAITLFFLGRLGLLPRLRFRAAGVRQMMSEGAPLLLASLSVIAFMRLDQVMLAQMKGTASVGYYSAALRITESFFVIATLMSVVLFPRILRLREGDPAGYRRMFVLLLRGFLLLGLALAVIIGILAEPIIGLLFGAEYAPAALLLQLNCWVIVPAFWGTITHRWIVAEHLTRMELFRTGMGLAMNVSLNLALIPAFGAAGACIATVVSQLTAYVAVNFVLPSMRPLARYQLAAINLRRTP